MMVEMAGTQGATRTQQPMLLQCVCKCLHISGCGAHQHLVSNAG